MKPVLSTFPGWDLLGRAFHETGFSVVHSPEWLWGQDICAWHATPDTYQGIIGGPPCQCFSRLVHMVRQNGLEPKFGNLIPQFERVVEEARPLWFLMEEVPDAPEPRVGGYGVHSFLLNNRDLGDAVNRLRRISFGLLGERRVLPLNIVPLSSPRFEYAALGGGSRRKHGRKHGMRTLGFRTHADFRSICRKQGLPDNFDLPGFTIRAKCQAVGNGVPMRMGRALAAAIIEVVGASL